MFNNNSIVLILDNLDESRQGLKKHLQEAGFAFTVEARASDEVLEKIDMSAKSGAPLSLILCDWNSTSSKNAKNFYQQIRVSPISKGIPIIVIASSQDLTEMLTVTNGAIQGYLQKPYSLKTLKMALSAVWESQK